MRAVILAGIVLLAGSLTAKEVPCVSPRGVPVTCAQPATWTSVKSKPPYNTLVAAGGEVKISGTTHWAWRKTVNTTCTPAQLANPSDKFACEAKVGQVMFVTPQFLIK